MRFSYNELSKHKHMFYIKLGGGFFLKQESLFAGSSKANQPLAYRVRPTTLDQFVGQEQLVGKGKVLREIIESDQLPSLIFWGPPGVGKTTLAEIIARRPRRNLLPLVPSPAGSKKFVTS